MPSKLRLFALTPLTLAALVAPVGAAQAAPTTVPAGVTAAAPTAATARNGWRAFRAHKKCSRANLWGVTGTCWYKSGTRKGESHVRFAERGYVYEIDFRTPRKPVTKAHPLVARYKLENWGWHSGFAHVSHGRQRNISGREVIIQL